MSNLRLGLVIDAIDNSAAVFKNFGRNVTNATSSVSDIMEKANGLTERLTSGIAGLGLGVGLGLEVRQSVEDSEQLERIGVAADVGKAKMADFSKAIYDTAEAGKVSADDLFGAWNGAFSGGVSMDKFIANASNLATQIQLVGGHGEDFGQALGAFQLAGVTAPDQVAQAFATMRKQLVGSGLDIGDVAKPLYQMEAMYSQFGPTGVQSLSDIGAVLGTIGATTHKPKNVLADVSQLLDIDTNRDSARRFTEKTSIPVFKDAQHSISLPELVTDIAKKYNEPGGAWVLDGIFPDNLARSLAGIYDQQKDPSKPTDLQNRLNMKGDPAKDQKNAADIGNGPIGILDSIQAHVRADGTEINDSLKPLWDLIGAHTGLETVLGGTVAGLTAAGWAVNIVKGGFSGLFGLLKLGTSAFALIQGGVAGLIARTAILASGALPAVGDALLGVAAVVEGVALGPIVAGVAAISLAAYGIYEAWDPMKKYWHDLWSGFGDDVDGLGKKIDNAMHNAASIVKDSAVHVYDLVSSGVNQAYDKITGKETQARAKQAMDYFTAHGRTKVQAAGIVANLLRESGLNETAIGDHGQAYGLAQWHRDRADAIAQHFHKSLGQMSFSEQLAAVDYEMRQGGEQRAGNALSGATNANDAGQIVSRQYERPGDSNGEAALRGGMADQLMKLIQPASSSKSTIQLTINGLPPGASVKAASYDHDIQVDRGHHMAPAQ